MRARPASALILVALLSAGSTTTLAAELSRPRPPWWSSHWTADAAARVAPSNEQILPDLLQSMRSQESAPARDAIASPFSSTFSLPQDAAWEGWLSPGLTPGNHEPVEWQGKLVLAGIARVAGHTACNDIAIWDGMSFETLPDPGDVLLIEVWNDQLVVVVWGTGGHSIKKFNGTSWDLLGVMNDYPECMGVFDDKLVIGGQFTSINSVPANRVAVFDGASWSALGAGFPAEPEYLLEHGGTLYAAGVKSSLSLKAWNPTLGIWEPRLDSSSRPRSLASDGQYLFVGGSSLSSNGSPPSGLMRWDGTNWATIPGTEGRSCSALTLWNGRVITTAMQPTVGRLSQWDGSTLAAVPGDSIGYGVASGPAVVHLGTWGSQLVATGPFVSNGSALVPNVALYDGDQWSTVGVPWDAAMRSPSGPIDHMRAWNGKLVVATEGRLVADLNHYKFTGSAVAYDGTQWQALSPNTLFAVYRRMTEWSGDLIFYGGELEVVGTGIRKMARWDGSSWHPLGSDALFYPDYIEAAVEFQDELYAAYYIGFHDGISRWNGTSWQDVGGGFPGGAAWALGVHGNSLVAGGSFTMAGVTAVNNIAAWNGASWSALGDGLSGGPVDAVVSWNGLLVAGGRFTASGAQPLEGAAFWDGTGWQQMGANVVGLWYLVVYNGELFASGTFRLPDNSEVFTLAKWTGTDWQLLGSGTNNAAFAFYGDHLYGAGSGIVHGHLSHGLSRVPISAVLDTPRPQPSVAAVSLIASPNPSRSHTRFTFQLPSAGHARLTVVDLAGRVVSTLADRHFDAGEHQASWDIAPAPGIYFVRLETKGGVEQVLRVARME